ncbi:MAG: RNA-directed DNA polymerase, partial [Bacteroidota bacterium]|nr:RNA-directed DNA polymerase [Bacteroidota bacterium]
MNNSDLVNDIANINNLMLAWEKLEGEISHQDDWYDVMELYTYKFQLKDKLSDLHDRLVNGTFQMHPLRPLPFPKGASRTENGDISELRVRQFFHVYIEDQLVWIAYCNVIAQFVECRMPGWSFGNRTDVRVWYLDVEGKREMQVGNYRNTRDRIYKKWSMTWPRYRKLLSLTIKLMSKGHNGQSQTNPELSEEEKQLLEDNKRYPEQNLNYLETGYFDGFDDNQIFWAGIDIEKFYPSIKRELIVKNLLDVVYDNRQSKEFKNLTNSLLDFKIDVTGFSQEELSTMSINVDGSYPVGLPTGLLVAGFLSNLALLGIDGQVKTWLASNHKIAHFRYVDDHVILAQDSHELVDWVRRYEELLIANGFRINKDKIEPKPFSRILQAQGEDEKSAVAELKGLDPFYPQPLMTVTLQKVSQMADMNVDQLTKAEFDILFADLQELLVMDISDQEIKKETRISFAVTMLSRILVHGDVDYEVLGRLKSELRKEIETKQLGDKKLIENSVWKEWFYRNDEYPELPDIEADGEDYDMTVANEKRVKINGMLNTAAINSDRKLRYIFNLIVKAIEDVPERSRIWIRMLQYCYNHKQVFLVEVFNLLDSDVIKSKMHPLSILYLRMMLLNKLALLVMKDLPRKDGKKLYEMAMRQLASVLDATKIVVVPERYYEAETYLFVNRVLMLAQIVNEKSTIDVPANVLYFGEWVDVDFWTLFYLHFVSIANAEKKDEVIETLLRRFSPISVYYPSLFLKCMSNTAFQKEVLKDAALDEGIIKHIKKHHLEIDVYRTFKKEYREEIASFLEMRDVNATNEGYISLSEWVFQLMAFEKASLLYAEQLEYIALKVALSVIKTMEEIHMDIFHFTTNCYINLFSLSINKDCVKKISDYDFWDSATDLTKYDKSIYPISKYPFDYNLFPSEYCDVY